MENAVCHFVFYTGPRKGEAQVYSTARVSIGRASNCDFRLEAFQLEQVAPHHAELLVEENAYYLYDLGTKSGTYVNGERVHDRCALLSEDYIQFGKEGPEVIFRVGEPLAGKQRLPEVFPVTAELEFFSGSDAGRIFPINAAEVSNLGRRADLEVPLDPRGDMIVSGNHCNIRYVNGHFVLTDTSRNGTYVNGELVDQPMEILDGDVIMLGDGGPQARFHVDDAKRHYPNHRALSPVAKSTGGAASSSFKRGAGDAAAPATLASAKPFLSGAPAVEHGDGAADPPPPVDAPLSEEAEAINEDVAAAELPVGTAGAVPLDEGVAGVPEGEPGVAELPGEAAADEDVIPAGEGPTRGAAAESEIPSAKSVNAFSAVPRPVRTLNRGGMKLSQNQKIMAGVGGAVILLIIIVALFSGGDGADTASSGRGDYGAALAKLEPVVNEAGAFKVMAPAGWMKLNRENFVSIESADKNIAVDYVRDGRVNGEHLQGILGKDGATVSAPESVKVGDKSVRIRRASVGNVRRVGAIIPAEGAPVMAVLEATQDTLDSLGDDVVQELLAGNVEITGAPAASVAVAPTPVPAPRAVAASPSPALPAPAVTPARASEPVSTSTVEATVAPVRAAATGQTPAGGDSATTKTGPVVSSRVLGVTVTAPAGWTGVSEEADEMLMFSDGKDLVVRIARDPGDLDAVATFKAMEDEGWKKEGVQDSPAYHAGEFVGKNQNLMLVLIPAKDKTTLLIYATSPRDFTDEQRSGISDIMKQLLPAP